MKSEEKRGQKIYIYKKKSIVIHLGKKGHECYVQSFNDLYRNKSREKFMKMQGIKARQNYRIKNEVYNFESRDLASFEEHIFQSRRAGRS